MTRGMTECFETELGRSRAKWLELAALPEGAQVEFVDPWDIFPEGTVPIGTRCVISKQYLNELHAALYVMPTTPLPLLNLREWDGMVILSPDGESFQWADEYAPAPIKIITDRKP